MKHLVQHIYEKLKISNTLTTSSFAKYNCIWDVTIARRLCEQDFLPFYNLIDKVFDIPKLYNSVKDYQNIFNEYNDNTYDKSILDNKIISELIEIISSILFSEYTVEDGFKILKTFCNSKTTEDLLTLYTYYDYTKIKYDNKYLLVFEHKPR